MVVANPLKYEDEPDSLDFVPVPSSSLDFNPDDVIENNSLISDIKPTSLEDNDENNDENFSENNGDSYFNQVAEPEIVKEEDKDKDVKTTATGKIPLTRRIKNWCYKHRKLLIVLNIIALLAVVAFIADLILNEVHLTTTTSGLDIAYDVNSKGKKIATEVPVRVLAYNADMGSSHELLYYVDTVATIDPDGTMNINWGVPRISAYRRSTYNEFCLLDESEPNDVIDEYCGGTIINTSKDTNTSVDTKKTDVRIPANTDDSTFSFSASDDDNYTSVNRMSCAYYIPSHSNGLIAFLSGWNKLGEDQKVGCGTNDGKSWGDNSYLDKLYGFSAGNFSHVDGGAGNDISMSGLTMENFFQSILNASGSDIDAGDIISNSFSDNFIYNHDTHVIDLAKTGAIKGQSCNSTSTTTISRPAPTNGSDNSTSQVWRCIPVFTVDEYGRITGVSSTSIEYDAVSGNEVVGVTGSYSGLVRSGTGTFLDPYTLAVALNSDGKGGLKIDSNGKLAIVAPQCNAAQNPQVINPTNMNQEPSNSPDTSLNKLQWTYTGENGKFTCVHDVDNQQLDMDVTETTSNNTNGVNTENTYTVSLTGDNASSVQFVDRNTDDQQISIDSDNDQDEGLNKVENYTVSLTGDNPSYIQFIDRDTRYTDGAGITLNLSDGANVFSADTGNGIILLCPDGSTNCSETEKTIQINIGGDNNTGSISGVNIGGLEFNINGQLKISAPVCDEDAPVLSWNGNKFLCVGGTDWNVVAEGTAGSYNVRDKDTVSFLNGTNGGGLTATRTDNADGTDITYDLNNTGVTVGSYSPTASNNTSGTITSRSINIPTFTVNSTGQLTQAGTQTILAVSADSSRGITINSDGSISLAGLNSTGTNCQAGSGLTWTGSTFTCTTPYSWNVRSGSGSTVNVAHGLSVSFTAGSGLSISNTTATGSQTINYAISLASGSGLQSDANGLSLAKTCTAGQILKWNGSAWGCADDKDTWQQMEEVGYDYETAEVTAYGITAYFTKWGKYVTMTYDGVTNATIPRNDFNWPEDIHMVLQIPEGFRPRTDTMVYMYTDTNGPQHRRWYIQAANGGLYAMNWAIPANEWTHCYMSYLIP